MTLQKATCHVRLILLFSNMTSFSLLLSRAPISQKIAKLNITSINFVMSIGNEFQGELLPLIQIKCYIINR